MSVDRQSKRKKFCIVAICFRACCIDRLLKYAMRQRGKSSLRISESRAAARDMTLYSWWNLYDRLAEMRHFLEWLYKQQDDFGNAYIWLLVLIVVVVNCDFSS